MLRLGALRGQQACLSAFGPKRTWCDRLPFSLLDHRDHLDLNHCLWLSETPDLDRRAGRTGYPEVAHAHVGALGECLVVRDEGVGLNNIGPSRASGLEAGVEVLNPHSPDDALSNGALHADSDIGISTLFWIERGGDGKPGG